MIAVFSVIKFGSHGIFCNADGKNICLSITETRKVEMFCGHFRIILIYLQWGSSASKTLLRSIVWFQDYSCTEKSQIS